MRRALLILVLLFAGQAVSGQRASIVFWNVENLYDTIPSPFHDDRDWTPQGANKWNAERYNAKIDNLARVLDELGADIVGLAEVENEGVVRDLVQVLKTDYNYIHRTSGDSRGIDLALLYKGDKFFPDLDPNPNSNSFNSDLLGPPKPGARLLPSGTGREFMLVRGELHGERVDLVVCHLASKLNGEKYRRRNMATLRAALENILREDPAANLIVMGDMNASPRDKIVKKTLGPLETPWDFMYAPHAKNHDSRQGSYSYRGRWYLYDWMMTSPAIARGSAFEIVDAGIYAREYLTEPATPDPQGARRPRRTFYGGDYIGGFSDHFPVYLVIVNQLTVN